jgi:CBS domain-containing protein
LLVHQVMTPRPTVIHPSRSAAHAAQLMQDRGVGWLPIIGKEQTIGVVTDRDLVMRVLARDLDPADTPVMEAATREMVSCSTETELRDAVDLMQIKKVRRLLVVDAEKKPAGVLSLADVAVRGDNPALAGMLLATVHTER